MNKEITKSNKGIVSNLADIIRSNIQTYAIVVALVAIWVLFSALTEGRFVQPQNFSNLFRQMTVTSFLAAGMVLVIVTGNIDLSVGKLAGFISVVVAHYQARVWTEMFPEQGVWTTALSILIGIGLGTAIGMLQGYIIAYLNVPSFITTLGTMWIMNGLILWRTEGKTIPANQPALKVIAQGYLPVNVGWVIAGIVVLWLFYSMVSSRRKKTSYGFELAPLYIDLMKTIFFSALMVGYIYMVNQYNGLQIPVLLLAVVVVVITYLSNNTRFGRYAYAIGGNREAARLSGVNIKKNIFNVFTLMGFLCGVGGVVLASYVGYGTIAAGQGYELDAIGAAILGGTSTLGGVGTVFGAMVGALIMTSLGTGLQILNIQAAWQYLVKGIVLVVAVFGDVYMRRSR
ncbi:MAG: sugar ABC transporter permease [Anaerolineales bacterium]